MNLSFQILDVVVVLVVIASAVYATYRGLVSESLAIFGWIAAAYATLFFGPWVAWWMQDMLSPHWLGQAAGYVLVFLVVLIPLQFAASRISQNVKKTQVGTIDSVLGTAFGILRGLAILGVAYLIFLAYAPNTQPGWLVNARLFPVIHASAEMVDSLIPDERSRVPRDSARRARESDDPIVRKLSGEEPADHPAAQPGAGAADPIAQKMQESADSPPPPRAKKPQPAPAKAKPVKHGNKTYGAKDRQALDKLIETTNSDASGKR